MRALVIALAAALLVTPAAQARPDEPASTQTSEGIRGPSAAPRTGTGRWRTVIGEVTTEDVAPGVTYRAWTSQSDPARDPMRVHVIEVDLALARLDLLAGRVPQRRTVLAHARDELALAAVNGDFFDIGDTGAPLGQSVDQQRGIRSGRTSGWNRAFWIGGDGVPHVGTLNLRGRATNLRRLRLASVNGATVPAHSIGVYTQAWGTTRGARVTDGRTRRVREVVLGRGRVVSNRPRLSRGRPITGRVLIGRGQGAARLRALRVGQRVRLRWGFALNPRVAVGGSEALVRSGALIATDDVELHPRTAVGIDRDTGHVLLMVVDGRSESSSGATMVELGSLMLEAGAEAALNLDGGGSSTLVARDVSGELAVRNAPSDGRQRPVPNGLVVLSR